MGSFDPDRFMNQTFDKATDTTVVPCPAGEWVGVTGEPEFKEITSSKTGLSYPQLTIPVSIENPEVTSKTGRSPTKVRWQTLLDLNENGDIDFGQGKNINLGRMREACGVNRPGVPFRFSDLSGKMVKVRVGHRADGNDPSILYDEVKAVSKG